MHAKTPEQVSLLLKYKADPNIQDQQKNTVLHQILDKYLPISPANSEQAEDFLRSIASLTENKADIYIKNNAGQSPYDMAMSCNDRKLQQIFLNAKDHLREQQRQHFNSQAQLQNKTVAPTQKIAAMQKPIRLKRR